MRHLDYPPVWLAGFAALLWAQAVWVPLGSTGAWGGPAGAVLVGLGLIVMLAAAWEFRRKGTTVVPHRAPSALVTGGVFRLSRNPIYLADLMILAGLALRWEALSGLLLVPILAWVLQVRFIRPEEARLAAAFGADYAAWCRNTRRWI